MIISVASGKGGTGKTTVATNLALSIDEAVQFLDCDVEEPNAHIFLKPEIKESQPVAIPIPNVDEAKCSFCGRCAEVCAYNAIVVIKPPSSAKSSKPGGQRVLSGLMGEASASKVLIFPELCHGCGGCSLLCPEQAISELGKEIGVIEIGSCALNPGTPNLPQNNIIQFIHGKLNIGEAMPTPLIRAVKALINPPKIVIVDVPPGTSCPVIEAVKGSDFCILVTEPTPFGLNDLILAVEVLKKLQIPFGIIINRADIGDDRVDSYCQENKIPILMRIPFDKEIASAYSRGDTTIEARPEYKGKFAILFNLIKRLTNT